MFIAAGSVYLSLRGLHLDSNSYVDVDDVGEDSNALLCHTNKTGCCGDINNPTNRVGEWYFPGGGMVQIRKGNQNLFYRDRGVKIVRLNRHGMASERGHFRCEVPDDNNVKHNLYIIIGMFSMIICILI